MFDVVNAKTVVPPEDSGILDITAGMTCRVFYIDGCYYKANILEVRRYILTLCMSMCGGKEIMPSIF